MRYISELVSENREMALGSDKFLLPYDSGRTRALRGVPVKGCRVNLLALGDVGGSVLTGLRLLGGETIDSIGIYDVNQAVLRRYEREINQICYPDGRKLPRIEIIREDQLFDCTMFVFCASKGVPPVGAGGDVRMAQLEANRELVSMFASKAAASGFDGIFAVVSDPVDPLCRAALDCGLEPGMVRGYGLGVMNSRARYFAEHHSKYGMYLDEGRAFGPHGEDLVIANSISNYDDELSKELTELAVTSNLVTRADGFKPYIAPAMSSGALSLIAALAGEWHYSSVYLGDDKDGAFLGCRNRLTGEGVEVENLPLDDKLFDRIDNAYRHLIDLN